MIIAQYTMPGIHVVDHEVDVPLNWFDEGNERRITVFARELVAADTKNDDLPLIVYLQGGPGGKSPRPADRSGWIAELLKTHRVILPDQRGTGRSSRVDARGIQQIDGAQNQADYLACFRADSIVRDLEHLRVTEFGGKRWETLGQSYGGFLTLTYLSQAPEGLAACHVTGGLASIDPSAAEVYRRTYPRTAAKNRQFQERYPGDVDVVARIADRLTVGDVLLPDGDVLTVRRFQSLGIDFGMKPGFERLHWLLDEAFAPATASDVGADELSDTFLAQVLARTSFADNPLFAVMQESIYGSTGTGATAWAAQREREQHPEFSEDARPLLFTGEMIYPWMFAETRLLRPFTDAVELLARRENWSPLYDLDRLRDNEVPVAAAVYYDDMYVDAHLQLDTASRVGNARAWVTNEFEHDGIGSARVVPRLREMVAEFGGPRGEREDAR
ncbi:alpha/beta hydrolase [Microbacterium sp. MPKO10]|uniref:alpha/beta hydrolase n=1 Tax=Microbacterium sp. MPKO10 TaxID=2989818 RepID=UPI002235BB7A|nr:alpha/beta hydrolase [Microbacterium sp. MPKO10]MCW4459986.1 alpha/beta hydrolase [Microbacterium sp. MPKO10]